MNPIAPGGVSKPAYEGTDGRTSKEQKAPGVTTEAAVQKPPSSVGILSVVSDTKQNRRLLQVQAPKSPKT